MKKHKASVKPALMSNDPLLHDPQAAKAHAKWGEASLAGWQMLPNVLLRNQVTLGLTQTDLLVLLNVLSFWWYSDALPFVKSSTIAKRMDVTSRTVNRSISKLIEKGYLKKAKGRNSDGAPVNCLDPSGLVSRLGTLARKDPQYKPHFVKKDTELENAFA